MSVAFTRPEWLLALPPVVGALWYAARGSYADLRGARLWVAWVVRLVIVLALVLALAGAQLVKPAKRLTVVFAVDGSYSVPAQERARALEFIREGLRYRRPEHRCALVVFGREARVESESLRRPQEVRVTSELDGGHTDISAGLRLAAGLVPPDSAGRVVLCSDGNENVGSTAEELLAAQAGRVTVDVLPLETRAPRDVLVRDVIVPSEARRGEPFSVRVAVEASHPNGADLTVLVDDEPVATRSVTMAAGASSLTLPVALAEAGFHKIDVLIEAEGDNCPENNYGTGFVRVRGKPSVLVVDASPTETEALRRALRLQDITVKLGGPASLPTSAADLENYDAVFLSDFPAYKMHHRQMVMLRDATRDRGVGLGMIGGEFGFGAGGYYRTPVEEALPVSMDVTKQRTFPASAVLIVMDTSGSMGMPEDGSTKIELAAEAGCAVVDLLQPYDSVGFVASDPAPTEVCKLQKLRDKASVKSSIRSVRAGGGGISVFPSLQAAYGILDRDESPVRHIILLADGSDCDEQQGSVPLVGQMAAEKISVTAVAFGDGPHVPFLKDVAAAGNGQFYLTERARDLKGIFTREALTVAKSVLIEETFRPQLRDATEVTGGLEWSSAPPLMGYVATSAKGLAQVPLVSHKDDPVLAHWQYGLGRSVAFTSDAKAHWAAHWLGWSQFPKFWGQVVRWCLRRPESGLLHPRVERESDSVRIVVEAAEEDGSLINGLEIRAGLSLPDGTRQELVLPQTAPGRYEAAVPAAQSGPHVVGVTASGPGGFRAQQTLGFSVPYPPDYADTGANDAFLAHVAQQTRGRALTEPEQAFAPTAISPRMHIDVWRLLLWIAAILLPLDVAVRRLLVRWEDLVVLAAAVRSAAGRLAPRRAPDAAATVGRLLEVKREQRPEEEPTTPVPPPAETGVPVTVQVPPPAEQPPPAAEPAAAPPDEPEAPSEEPEAAPASTTSRLLKRKRQLRER